MTSMTKAFAVNGMTELTGENTLVIHAPTQKVYDYLLDFTKHSEWALNVSKVTKISDGPIGVGTTFQTAESVPPAPFFQKMRSMMYFMRGVLSGAKTYSDTEITALEPGRRIAWTGRVRKGNGDFNMAHWEFIIEPQDGDTRLTQCFRYVPQNATSQRMLSALGGAAGLKVACAKSLARLKSVLER